MESETAPEPDLGSKTTGYKADRACRVLIVEDNPLDVELVKHSFRRDRSGTAIQDVDLRVANTFREAACLLASMTFDAVLLDMGLPDGSGLPLLKKFIQLQLDIPIVILTGNDDEKLGIEALRLGADDYLNKIAISPASLPRAVRYAIERNRRMILEEKLNIANAEMFAAQKIQRRLLPAFAPQLQGFEIYASCLTADQTGGDLYDFLSSDDDSLTGVVADVSGHGFASALIMTELHGLLHGLADQQVCLPKLVTAAQRRVSKATGELQFITMFTFLLSRTDSCCSYLSAGHPGWLIPATGETTNLKPQRLPLGVHHAHDELTMTKLPLESGDIVLIPTDGLYEAVSPWKELFGITRMLDLVREHRDKSAAEIGEALFESTLSHANADRPQDDCALILIKKL